MHISFPLSSMTYNTFPDTVGVLYPDKSIAQFLWPLIAFNDTSFPFELRAYIELPEMTGLAEISLISKLLKTDILDKFSDQIGRPVSYMNAISSPLLNGAITKFSLATSDAVNKFFFCLSNCLK